jgi:rfaE bifunctional protein kinase chain/domain
MVQDKSRPTTVKTRISGKCSQSVTQQVVRIDRQSSEKLSKEIEDKVLSVMEDAIKECDGVILSDYHLGFLTDKIIENAVKLAKKHNKIIVADVQKEFAKYKGVTAITPNMPDSEKYLGYFIRNNEDLAKAGETIVKELELKNLLLTKGADGMTLFEAGETISEKSIPAFNKKEVFDVTGAGDTVVATYTLALCAGLSPYISMVLGNLAASIVIRQFGCHSITIQEMIDEINNSGVKYEF